MLKGKGVDGHFLYTCSTKGCREVVERAVPLMDVVRCYECKAKKKTQSAKKFQRKHPAGRKDWDKYATVALARKKRATLTVKP